MIPESDIGYAENDERVYETSNTYNLRVDEEKIYGKIDNIEAMKQAIYKIINTERYEYPIYSFNYGIELQDLFGMPKTIVWPELKRRLKEAILQDDRINDVYDFVWNKEKSKASDMFISFKCDTIFGSIDIEEVFKIGGI